MSSQITIHCGQAGNQLAAEYWTQIIQEHKIDEEGAYYGNSDYELERIKVNFSETSNKRYVPRVLNIDLEPGVIDTAKASNLGRLYKPDSYIAGQSDYIDRTLEVIRKEAESCDLLQGFSLLHSLGGGTGSGLGCLILQKLREEFPDRMLNTWTIYPAANIGSDTITEPYNTILALHQLLETSDMSFIVENGSLFDIAQNQLKNPSPSFRDINKLVAQAMCGATSSLRFPGQLNSDLRKMAVNMVPFPRLHFFSLSFAPFSSETGKSHQMTKISELAQQLFNPSALMAACDPRLGKFLTAMAAFRGSGLSAYEIEEAMRTVQERNQDYFVNFDNNICHTQCEVAAPGLKLSGTLIANNTSIKDLFARTASQFSAMYRRRAFTHWYTLQGMDEMEWHEAESNVLDLVSEYQQYEGDMEDEEYEEQFEGESDVTA